MTVPLNELFERTQEAVTILDSYAQTMLAIFRGETGCKIELLAHTRGVVEAVEQSGEDVVQRLTNLAADVEGSERDLAAASDAAEGALRDVAAAAPEVDARASAAETDAAEKNAEIARERDAALALLDDEMPNAREDAARTLAAAEALAALLSTRVEETRAAMAELQTSVQEAAAELGAAARRFLDAAAEVERTTAYDAVAYRAGIDALVQQAASSMTSLANRKVEAHNGTLGPLRQRLTEDEPQELAEAVSAAIVAMQPLLRLCDERDDALVRSAEKCEPLAEDGSGVLEKIVEITDFVTAVL